MNTMDSAYVTGSSSTVHTVNCPTVTRMIVGGGAIRMVRARKITKDAAAQGLAAGRYSRCRACAKIEAGQAAKAPESAAPAPAAAPVAAESEPTQAPQYRANSAGRDQFLADLRKLADAGRYEEITERVRKHAAALGPRKPEWLKAVGWYDRWEEMQEQYSQTATMQWFAMQGMVWLTYANV